MMAEWIRVEKRLPAVSGKYLVTATDGDEFVDIAYFDRKAFNGEGVFDYGDVIAWMPLPSPYRKNLVEQAAKLVKTFRCAGCSHSSQEGRIDVPIDERLIVFACSEECSKAIKSRPVEDAIALTPKDSERRKAREFAKRLQNWQPENNDEWPEGIE